MENKKLTNEQLDGIIEQLKVKQNNLKAVAALVPMFNSCIADYDMLMAQVQGMKTPTATVKEKEPTEKKS